MSDAIHPDRRSFLTTGALAAGAMTAGAALAAGATRAVAQTAGPDITEGDVAILRFFAALELVESDFWLQYAELGGVQNNELPGLPTGGSAPYTAALQKLDADMPQYISDNTDDEISHATFLNAYLVSKGGQPINLDPFRTLPSSRATGANQIGRLTNLMQLTLDTSWWTRYRSRTKNPDLNPGFKFPQAVPSLANGQFTAIPRTDADLAPRGHIQAIANTAAFHFATIEQGGSSLYPTLAQHATNAEVLRILVSIGPTETSHFQTWHDKAGNAVSQPLAPLTDPTNPKLVFPDLNSRPFGGPEFQTNLIMPEPCPFLSTRLPVVSIVRPTSLRENGAMAVVQFLTAMGLFIGQTQDFFDGAMQLASEADKAMRQCQ